VTTSVVPEDRVPANMVMSSTHRRRNRSLSRRQALASALGLGGTALAFWAARRPAVAQEATPSLAHAGHGDTEAIEATPSWLLWEPADLIEPEVRSSAAGGLRTDLHVVYAYHDIGGYRLAPRTYEGGIPGPTLRVQPGDTIRLTLINDLLPNRDSVPANGDVPHHFNTTNIHFHGMHVSPAGIADNVLRSMEPGARYDVEIAIPDDHPRGTYWYHPHHHGSADVQISSGMAGALIVDGDFADVPEIAAARERVLVLNEVIFDNFGTIENYDTVWPEAVPRFLAINGQREPIIRMQPGEVQRWRIVQACHESDLRLALDGHPLHAVAYDGIRLSTIEQHDSLVVVPGQRADILVRAGEPGEYQLAAVANDQGYPSPTGPLAHIVVAGDPLPMDLPAALPAPPLAPIADTELTGARRLTLSTRNPEYPPAANYEEFAFLIDGQQFDSNRVDQAITLGSVEEWTVVNDDEADHVFHIHTNPFQVMAVNGEAPAAPLWRDTAIVPRQGSLTFRSRFLDFTGKSVLHCHMMNHEELGMMQMIEFSEAG
jgi:FtsP/CotA-like multicopper oxidase with cupredoxin domain